MVAGNSVGRIAGPARSVECARSVFGPFASFATDANGRDGTNQTGSSGALDFDFGSERERMVGGHVGDDVWERAMGGVDLPVNAVGVSCLVSRRREWIGWGGG